LLIVESKNYELREKDSGKNESGCLAEIHILPQILNRFPHQEVEAERQNSP